MNVCLYQGIRLEIGDAGLFSLSLGAAYWPQDPNFAPHLITAEGKTLFSEARKIQTSPYVSGLGRGFMTRMEDFPGKDWLIEALVYIDQSGGMIHCRLSFLKAEGILEAVWPAPFKAESKRSTAVLPVMQGAILPSDWPVAAPKRPFAGQLCSSASYMPWYGEYSDEGGYITMMKAPWDAATQIEHPAGGPTRIIPRQLSSLGKFEGSREILIKLCPAGTDYNALSQIYRAYAEEAGLAVTLREKAVRCPSLHQLVGASVLHLGTKTHKVKESAYYDAEHPEKNDSLIPFSQNAALLKELKKAGYGKIYLHLDGWGQPGYDNKHPDYLPACLEAGGYEGLRDLIALCREQGGLFGLHDQYRDYYLDAESYDPDNAVTLATGEIFEMARWAGGRQNYLCPALAPDYVKRNYESLKKEKIDIDCVYLDVFTCNEPDECLNPHHRVTREQCLRYRMECFHYMLSRGILTSSEEAQDWALPALVFCHWAPYSPLGIPTPLFNLCFHDCLMIPWMLGKGAWGTPENQPGFLHALLNGGMGYIAEGAEGESREQNLRETQIVSALHERVALCKMTGHSFLDPLGKRQESTFSDGTRVRVDFESNSYDIVLPLD